MGLKMAVGQLVRPKAAELLEVIVLKALRKKQKRETKVKSKVFLLRGPKALNRFEPKNRQEGEEVLPLLVGVRGRVTRPQGRTIMIVTRRVRGASTSQWLTFNTPCTRPSQIRARTKKGLLTKC